MSTHDLVAQPLAEVEADESNAHTCYSAPVMALASLHQEPLVSGIPWFGVTFSHGVGWCVGHVRGWSPGAAGLQLRLGDEVTSSRRVIEDLREAGSGLVRIDGSRLPWVVESEDRWLRWFAVQPRGEEFEIVDRLTIAEGGHRQAASRVRVDADTLADLLRTGGGPLSPVERRRESVFLDVADEALDAPSAWLVPGVPAPVPGPTRAWESGPAAVDRVVGILRSGPDGDELTYWQEELWQAGRYRLLREVLDGGSSAAAGGATASAFFRAGALTLHATLRPAGPRRLASLEAASQALLGVDLGPHEDDADALSPVVAGYVEEGKS